MEILAKKVEKLPNDEGYLIHETIKHHGCLVTMRTYEVEVLSEIDLEYYKGQAKACETRPLSKPLDDAIVDLTDTADPTGVTEIWYRTNKA